MDTNRDLGMSKVCIYLDLNVFADLRAYPANPTNARLISILMFLRDNAGVEIVYSECHIHELSFTGHKGKLSPNERRERIDRDLEFIKVVTNCRKLSRNIMDQKFYIENQCPVKYFENLESNPLFSVFKKLVGLSQVGGIGQMRDLVGLGPRVLNNLRNDVDAQLIISSVTESMPKIFLALSKEQREQLEFANSVGSVSVAKEFHEIFATLRETFERFREDINVPDNVKELLSNAIVELNEKSEAISIASGKSAEDGYLTSSAWSLESVFQKCESILRENNLSMSREFMEKFLRNSFGFESKPLKTGSSSDYFDIQHSDYLNCVSFFITNEEENFKKRFSKHASIIYSKQQFVEIMNDRFQI